jgi:DNA repair protein RadC
VAATSRAWRIALPHYQGHRERLRQRFHAAGGDTVTGCEFLDLVLFGAQSW